MSRSAEFFWSVVAFGFLFFFIPYVIIMHRLGRQNGRRQIPKP